MKKKLIIYPAIFLVFIFSLNGCGGGGGGTHFLLKGLPYNSPSYQIELDALNNGELLKTYDLGVITDQYDGTLSIDKNTTNITIYLLVNNNPSYFCSFHYYPGNDYLLQYWLDYNEYINNGKIKFGISESLAQNANYDINIIQSFDYDAYFLYKLTNARNRSVGINIAGFGGKTLMLATGVGLPALTYTSTIPQTFNSQAFQNYSYDNLYILIEPGNYNDIPTAQIRIWGGANKSVVNGLIVDMVAGGTPDKVFAVDKVSDCLYYINPSTRTIENTYPLPYTSPMALSYSLLENKLYIVYDDTSNVTVWDITSHNYTDFNIQTWMPVLDIEVATTLQRIYILTLDSLFIYNLNTLQKISSCQVGSGSSIRVDQLNQKIYIGDKGTSPSHLQKYSISGDNPTFQQSISFGGFGGTLALSPDGTKILLAGVENKLSVYSCSNLNTVLGYWNIGDYPTFAAFNLDGSILYATNQNSQDNNLYVLNAQNYSLIRKIPFPYADKKPMYVINSNGTVLVSYSTMDWNITYPKENCGSIYYFDNIQKNNSASLTRNDINNIKSQTTIQQMISHLPSPDKIRFKHEVQVKIKKIKD